MKRILWLLFCGLAMHLTAADAVWQTPFRKTDELKSWTRYDALQLNNDGLVLTNPEGKDGMRGIFRDFPAEAFRGRHLRLTGEWRGDGIRRMDPRIGGPRIRFALICGKKILYPGVPVKLGTFPWEFFEIRFVVPDSCSRMRLFLGFQSGSGTLGIRNLKLEDLGTPVSLRESANMGYADPVAGDGKGGWSDQGPENDASLFRFQQTEYAQVPFSLLSPESNGGRTVLVFRSQKYFPSGLERAELPVSPNAGEAGNLYLLHTACWAQRLGRIGTIRVEGSGGVQEFTVELNREAADQWNPHQCPNGWIGARWSGRNGTTYGLYVSVFPLKRGLGKIRKITLEKGTADAVWIVAGMTLSREKYPIGKDESQKFTVQEGPRFRALRLPETPEVIPGSALDFSGLLPEKLERLVINRHGRIARESSPEKSFRLFGAEVSTGSKAAYVSQDDGKPKRVSPPFWKDKESVSRLVREVKRRGYNMLRAHCTDIVTVRNGKAAFNPEKIDLWDWCIAECGRNGIYFQIDTISSTGFSGLPEWSREGKRRFSKFRMLFRKEMREEYKTGLRALLEHVNPYTGKSLRDDPILGILNLCNEQELALAAPDLPWQEALPEWRKFCGDPDAPIFTREEMSAKNAKGRKIKEFMHWKWREMIAWYKKTVREELGCKAVTSLLETNTSIEYNILRNDLDAVMRHSYHAHTTNRCTVQTQSSDLGSSARMLRAMYAGRLIGKPFLVNEYAAVYWNRYRYEEPFAVAAYASFLGFDLLLRHGSVVHFEHGDRIFPWIMHHDPITRASQTAAALLYARGDVREAEKEISLMVSEKEVREKGLWNNHFASSPQTKLALMVKYGLELSQPGRKASGVFGIPADGGGLGVDNTEGFSYAVEPSAGGTELGALIRRLKQEKLLTKDNRSDGIYRFENATRELYLDAARNFMTVNTPRFQGVAGEEKAKAVLRDVTLELRKNRGAVSVASLQKEKGIREANRLLVIYATNALCSKMTFEDPSMIHVLSYGENPVLIETGTVFLTLRNSHADKLKVYPLQINGRRGRPLETVTCKNGILQLTIDTHQLPEGPALFFELAEQ